MAGAAKAVGTNAIFTITDDGILVSFGGKEWLLRPEAFGLASISGFQIQESPAPRLTIPRGSLPGTGLTFNLQFDFHGAGTNAAMRISARSAGGLAGANCFSFDVDVPFAGFIAGTYPVSRPLSARETGFLAQRLGWKVVKPAPGSLRFWPNGQWSVVLPGLATQLDDFVRGDRIDVRVVHGDGLLDRYLETPGAWATESSLASLRLRKRPRFACGASPEFKRVELRPRNISRFLAVRWQGADVVAYGMSGTWRTELVTAKGRSGGFESTNGLVIVGRSGGSTDIVAALPITEEMHSVSLPGGGATVRGIDEHHRLELRSRDGRVDTCVARALLARIALPLEGADLCQLEFDDDEMVALLDGRRRIDGLSSIYYAVAGMGRWHIPLGSARLRVARAQDLLSLSFRFRGMTLERRWEGWRFEPTDDGMEPALIAEFPPQHILERAFFRQINIDPVVPPVRTVLDPVGGRQKVGHSPGELDPDLLSPSNEGFVRVVEARLSGPSRLAFEVPRKGRDIALPFTLDALTTFARLQLKVAKRASTLMTPEVSTSLLVPPRLVPVTDAADILKEQGIRPGQPLSERLKEVVGPLRHGPEQFDTAIEIPARLIISPDQRSRFETHAIGPATERRAPLFSARLVLDQSLPGSGARAGSVRAIASPDFEPTAFNSPGKSPRQTHEVTWLGNRALRLPMSDADRHEIVALSAGYGLPTLPRLPARGNSSPDDAPLAWGNVTPPSGYSLRELDGEQGVYIPPTMTVRELALSSLGGTLNLEARFEPPAAPFRGSYPIYDALNVEGWDHDALLARDRRVQLIYKGFLFPLGHRASLLKLTERYFMPVGNRPVGYLIQRYFIRISKPMKEFGSVGHPYGGLDFPSKALEFKTRETPDILDPQGTPPANPREIADSGRVGLVDAAGKPINGAVFWPRIHAGLGGEVVFELQSPGERGVMSLPLLFLDNTAAHDPDAVRAVVEYYNELNPSLGLSLAALNGAARRYAPEPEAGAATFETARWVVGARGRIGRPADPYRMDAAMEGADQPPFYPYMREAHVRLRSLQRFANRLEDDAVVSYDELYTRFGMARERNPAQAYLQVHGYLPKDRADWFAGTSIEPVRLSLTGVGDRSGGVAQPNAVAVGMSLITGPIGGQRAPDRSTFGTPAPPAPMPLARLAPPPDVGAVSPTGARAGIFSGMDFFPADAMILGLIPLRTVVQTALYGAAPKLVEKLDAAEDAVMEQLEAIRSQIAQALKEAPRIFPEIRAQLSIKVTPGNPGSTLLDFYPRLATALDTCDAAQAALVLASRGMAGLATLKAIVDAVKAFNTAVSDLLAELDRLGRNPMPEHLDELLDQAMSPLRQWRDMLTGESLRKLIVGDAGKFVTAVAEPKMRPWLATTFGPDAYEKAVVAAQAGDIDGAVKALAQTAAEALAYETVGRPVLAVLGEVEELARRQGGNLAGDVLVVIERAFRLLERLSSAAVASLEGPLALAGDVSRGCNDAASGLAALVGTQAGLVDASLGDALEALDLALTPLADLQHRAEKCVASVNAVLERMPDSTERIRVVEELRKVEAGRVFINRIRSTFAGRIDRVREQCQSMTVEAREMANDAGQVCSAPDRAAKRLGDVTRWMTLRVAAIGNLVALLRELASALDVPLPKQAGQIALADAAHHRAARGCADDVADLVDECVRQAGEVLAAAISAARRLTSLSSQAAGNKLKSIVQTLDAAIGAQASELGARLAAVEKARAAIPAQLDSLTAKIAAIATPGSAAPMDAMKALIVEANAILEEFDAFAREGERALVGAVAGQLALLEDEARETLVGLAGPTLLNMVGALRDVHDLALKPWNALRQKFTGQTRDILKLIFQEAALDPLFGDLLHQAFTDQRSELDSLAKELEKVRPSPKALHQALQLWRSRIAVLEQPPHVGNYGTVPAIVAFARELAGLIDTLVHGRAAQLIDIDGLRARAEKMLLSIAFPKVNLSYELDCGVSPLPPFFRMEEGAGERLNLTFDLSIDTQDSKPVMKSTGRLDPFLVEIPTVVTLEFSDAKFAATNGGDPEFDIKVKNVRLGNAVAFVQRLQEYLGLSGSGFFLDFQLSPPGVEAGFMFDLGTLSIGNVSFINISLGASVLLPFDNRPALFKFNLARRSAPFLISCAPFGGGGFFAVIFDAKGIVGFEASFEYGGVAGFGFGPLRGQGRVTTGIYISRSGGSVRVSGFFVAAGSAHIACFGIGACLLVTVGQDERGRMRGNATFTYSFSLGLKDLEFEVPVSRLIPQGWGGGGGNGFVAERQSSEVRTAIAEAAALSRLTLADGPPQVLGASFTDTGGEAYKPTNRTEALAMDEDWTAYRRYFDEEL